MGALMRYQRTMPDNPEILRMTFYPVIHHAFLVNRAGECRRNGNPQQAVQDLANAKAGREGFDQMVATEDRFQIAYILEKRQPWLQPQSSSARRHRKRNFTLSQVEDIVRRVRHNAQTRLERTKTELMECLEHHVKDMVECRMVCPLCHCLAICRNCRYEVKS